MRSMGVGRKYVKLRAVCRMFSLLLAAGWVSGVLMMDGNSPALALQREKDRPRSTSNQNSNQTTTNVNRTAGNVNRKQRQRAGSSAANANAGRRSVTRPRPDIYRVRVTLIGPEKRPIDDADMWSTYGGEKLRVEGGLIFQIPAASIPKDGKLTLYASKDNAFLRGQGELQLGNEPNPVVIIEMTRHTTGVVVRGTVVDEANNAVEGARVSVTGHESEAVVTKANGGFVLPAHAAVGQQVLLRAEKAGYKAVSQYHPAGDEPATLTLERR